MSNPEVGEVFVTVRPNTEGFAEALSVDATQAAERAEQAVNQQIDAASKKINELQSQAETASLKSLTAQLTGNKPLAAAQEFASGLFDIQAKIAQAEFAAEQSLRAAAEAMGVQREQLLASAEVYHEAARVFQDQLDRSKEAGKIKPPDVPGQEGGGGLLGQLGGLLGGASAGRTGGLGGITALITRLGPLGLAAGAAFSAFQELQGMLRVTGDEAFTTSGKIRNAAGQLTSLNVIGAFKALTADRPAELSGGLQAGLTDLENKTDKLFLSEEKLIAIRDKSEEGLQIYLQTLAAQGHISDETAAKLDKVVNTLRDQRSAAKAAEEAMFGVARAIEAAGTEAAAFGERGGDFGRGVGGVERGTPGAIIGQQTTGIPRVIRSPDSGGVFRAAEEDIEKVQREVRESLTKRTKNDRDRLKLEVENARILQDQARAAFESARGGENAAAAYRDLVVATTGVALATRAAAEAADQAAEEARRMGDSVREAQAARIADDGARDQATLRARQIEEKNAKQALDAARDANKSEAERNRLYTEWQQAITRRVQLEQQISEDEKKSVETAAANAANARAQSLENQIAKAALTARKTDDEAAFAAAIDYWKSLARNAKDAAAREEAEAQVIDLRKRRQAFRRGEGSDAEHTAAEMEELRISVRQAQARLTPGLEDDRKFAQQLVTFWKGQVKILEGWDRAQAQLRLAAAQLALKGLKNEQGESPDVFVNRLFAEAAEQFRRFGSNIASESSDLLSPQDARGRLGGILSGSKEGQERAAQRTRDEQLAEAKKQTRWLQIIADGPRRKVPVGAKIPKEAEALASAIGGNILRGL